MPVYEAMKFFDVTIKIKERNVHMHAHVIAPSETDAIKTVKARLEQAFKEFFSVASLPPTFWNGAEIKAACQPNPQILRFAWDRLDSKQPVKLTLGSEIAPMDRPR